MTDKQIIIDGVDVSGCNELYNGCCCDNGSFYCSDQPNCQFKLEKRGYKLEQITEFTPREELIETITHLRVLNAELETYNEQLKESQNIEIKENKILREQLKRTESELACKEQECESLKDKLNCCFCNPHVELNDIEKQRKCVEVTECFRRQLDQLKAENEILEKVNKANQEKIKKLNEKLEEEFIAKQYGDEALFFTLMNIKEICNNNDEFKADNLAKKILEEIKVVIDE